MTMIKRSPKLLIILCCCLSLGCDQPKELDFLDDVQRISIDLSPNNPERSVHQEGAYAGESSMTISSGESITQEGLASTLKNIQSDEPILELVMPSNDGWVFYIGHNGKSSTKITLHLTGDLDVMLNEKKHTKAFELSAGVHGFKVDRKENVIQVEHVIVPYKEP